MSFLSPMFTFESSEASQVWPQTHTSLLEYYVTSFVAWETDWSCDCEPSLIRLQDHLQCLRHIECFHEIFSNACIYELYFPSGWCYCLLRINERTLKMRSQTLILLLKDSKTPLILRLHYPLLNLLRSAALVSKIVRSCRHLKKCYH